MSQIVTISCPHCNAALEIDLEAGVVIGHSVPLEPRDKVDFDARLKQIEDDKLRASDRMAEALRKEKDKDRIMADRFRKLMEDAKNKEGEKPPVKDIDL